MTSGRFPSSRISATVSHAGHHLAESLRIDDVGFGVAFRRRAGQPDVPVVAHVRMTPDGVDEVVLPQHRRATRDPVDPSRRVRRHSEESDRSHPVPSYPSLSRRSDRARDTRCGNAGRPKPGQLVIQPVVATVQDERADTSVGEIRGTPEAAERQEPLHVLQCEDPQVRAVHRRRPRRRRRGRVRVWHGLRRDPELLRAVHDGTGAEIPWRLDPLDGVGVGIGVGVDRCPSSIRCTPQTARTPLRPTGTTDRTS